MAKSPTEKSTSKAKTKGSTKPKAAAADAVGAASGSAVKEPEVIAASAHRDEAKSRFNSALEEAKAGAAALKAEAGERVGAYRSQADEKRGDLINDARAYGDEAKVRAGELAVEGKAKASDALAALGKMVADNATQIDDQFGPKYGDYARNAARSLQENAAKLEAKSIEEIGEDTKEFVRKSPGTALGIAAIGGYILARLFRR
ncbi:hypothetical protein [Erythrobacter litoralis]|uniref:DUF883 domain-containing protein n=1 Tax=Erythrobacter litoralis (strain HTCC2594) TaxID=314225 RepID=Q2NAQ3_ERYLH|nr:hypothetical protein [Erythrobacter litoralis]ABC63238.1 hypothetical protein ELI_05730 [Erythrobacter litoralis HTCC2594]